VTSTEVRNIRKACGLNQSQLAELCSCSRQMIWKVETGQIPVPISIEAVLKRITPMDPDLGLYIDKKPAREQIAIRRRQHDYRSKAK
jgi:transcriptional regulator with XRE-family HTH domain